MYLLAIAAVATVLAVVIRDCWRNWRQAEREYRQAETDEQWARQHRIDL